MDKYRLIFKPTVASRPWHSRAPCTCPMGIAFFELRYIQTPVRNLHRLRPPFLAWLQPLITLARRDYTVRKSRA